LSYTLILHIQNSDPVVGDTDEIPNPNDILIMIKNPRRMDGKDIPYLAENVVTVFFPIERLNYIEVLAGEEEEGIIGFVRE
jgi:hypothetical protein